ncbi:MAG: hypothetical protein RR475_00395 [Clostridia bacterium]
MVGLYDDPDVPKDVYRRHKWCRCVVEYDLGTGKRQDIWSKQWITSKNNDKLKQFDTSDLASDLVQHPGKLASYTPKSLREAFIKAGYDVKPLKQGLLRNLSFENGGGYKVNFTDGGLFQYHPKTNSHHGRAYYKTSTGKGGTHHYDIDGTEKKK